MKLDTLENHLPNNPLAHLPYWGHPNGENLTPDACLHWLIKYLEVMNEQLPCPENKDSLWHLKMVEKIQGERRQRRIEQGVIGTSQPHKFTYNGPSEIV